MYTLHAFIKSNKFYYKSNFMHVVSVWINEKQIVEMKILTMEIYPCVCFCFWLLFYEKV